MSKRKTPRVTMHRVSSYDKKTGDPLSWWECCGPLKEVERKHLPGCDCAWPCKCKSLEITYRCQKCGKTAIEVI